MGSKHWQEPFATVPHSSPCSLQPYGHGSYPQSPGLCRTVVESVWLPAASSFYNHQNHLYDHAIKSFSSLSSLSCQKLKKKISFLFLFWGCSNSDLELSCFVTLLPPHSVNISNIVHIPLIIFHQYLEEVFSKN